MQQVFAIVMVLVRSKRLARGFAPQPLKNSGAGHLDILVGARLWVKDQFRKRGHGLRDLHNEDIIYTNIISLTNHINCGDRCG